MTISIFDLFSIGIGPSSSHTVGPMRAALRFAQEQQHQLDDIDALSITLYGSLAYTGDGHGTLKALALGLMGYQPDAIDPDEIPTLLLQLQESKKLSLLNEKPIDFELKQNIILNKDELLPSHSNGMSFTAYNKDKQTLASTIYYSIGGGFVISEEESQATAEDITTPDFPYPFSTAAELITHCQQNAISIADVMLANEKVWHEESVIKQKLLHIAEVMLACIERGIKNEGELAGGLHVQRRAPELYKKLIALGPPALNHEHTMNWLNLYAMAVNEENAAGGRVVTAPTNGAAGIIPAILNFYNLFYKNPTEDGVINLLLTAGAIGILYKKNASISGAEMGCQGEVGVACSMAAGGLAAAMGGSVTQVENAAEIGMEHNLGLTCDPVNGLVQIPCIERNAMGAVKAVNAAQLALAEDTSNKVSLDMVINTMREIGRNMNSIYKETSLGGLAVNVPEC